MFNYVMLIYGLIAIIHLIYFLWWLYKPPMLKDTLTSYAIVTLVVIVGSVFWPLSAVFILYINSYNKHY